MSRLPVRVGSHDPIAQVLGGGLGSVERFVNAILCEVSRPMIPTLSPSERRPPGAAPVAARHPQAHPCQGACPDEITTIAVACGHGRIPMIAAFRWAGAGVSPRGCRPRFYPRSNPKVRLRKTPGLWRVHRAELVENPEDNHGRCESAV